MNWLRRPSLWQRVEALEYATQRTIPYSIQRLIKEAMVGHSTELQEAFAKMNKGRADDHAAVALLKLDMAALSASISDAVSKVNDVAADVEAIVAGLTDDAATGGQSGGGLKI